MLVQYDFSDATDIQFTLFLQRVNKPTDSVKNNGFYMQYLDYGEGETNKQVDATDATYNSVAVQDGESLVGIVGFDRYHTLFQTSTGTQSMSINYTSPTALVFKSSGFDDAIVNYRVLFFAVTPPTPLP